MIKKRVFFAFPILAPWPSPLPKGRIIQEEQRHLTVAFLGEIEIDGLMKALDNFPAPSLALGITGIFDRCLFLPKRHPNVVSWHISWLSDPEWLIKFQKNFSEWLATVAYPLRDSDREWLPHVTIARQPFEEDLWKRSFSPLPMALGNFCLYESMGELQYQSIWTYPISLPFKEIDHTADLAFDIFGRSCNELFLHAETALAFKFPALLAYQTPIATIHTLDNVIMHLNELIYRADSAIGCPFKAVSFHGELQKIDPHILKWEMIIDV